MNLSENSWFVSFKKETCVNEPTFGDDSIVRVLQIPGNCSRSEKSINKFIEIGTRMKHRIEI